MTELAVANATDAGIRGRAPAGALSRRFDLSVHDRLAGIEADWRALESEGTSSVYQRFDWVSASLETLDRCEQRRAFVVLGRLDGKPAFLLPLSIRGSLAAELNWAGGSHANFNTGLYSRAFLDEASACDIRESMQRIGRLVRGIGFISMCCQPESWRGVTNPMLALPHQRSVNQAWMMDLRGGFEALLQRGNAKRKKKKFRAQVRAAEQAGGYRLLAPDNRKDSDFVLGEFLAQKSARLREQGKTDVFASQHARRFLQDIAVRSLGMAEPLLALFALEIGGRIRAIFGGGVHHRQLSGYFSSIALDDMTTISPGEMLLYLVAERCARDGIEFVDLGAGDERYKRSWCDVQVGMFDVIMPTSPAGLPLALAKRALNAGKRVVRESPQLWQVVGAARQARRLLNGSYFR